MRMRWIVPGIVVLVALGVGGYWAFAERQYRGELDQAKHEMAAGRFGTARQRLVRLAESWPSRAEVHYRLGLCEQAAGRFEAAMDAWEKVPLDSPFGVESAVRRGGELINSGRYTPAETVLGAALSRARPGEEEAEARRALSRLYRFQGRQDDVRRQLQAGWAYAEDKPGVLKELWLLDTSPMPVEALAVALEKADPNDPRVRLGRANLAILTGRHDEAKRWLDRFEPGSSMDLAYWLSRLDLARASDDVEAAWEAMATLPASLISEADILSLRCWLLAERGDRRAERAALSKLVEHEPGNTIALDRLASLATEAGDAEEARRFRERKARADRAKDQFRKLLLDGGDLRSRAGEFARLATSLGRRFDAWAWSVLAKDGAASAGPSPVEVSESTPATTIAQALADLRPSGGKAGASGPAKTALTIPSFTDLAESSGPRFVFDNGQTALRQLPETMSGGVALLDYDGDGWLDVFVVQGGPLADDPTLARDGDRLFRNRGDGGFEDVTVSSGIAAIPRGYGLGVAVGDVDNDGHPDLFLTRLRSYALLRNQGDGTFRDATETWGLAGNRDNPTSAAFADLDGDGDIDLYVCHYMIWDPSDPRLCKNEEGEYFYCDPSRVDPAPDRVFRNDGGRFVEVTKEAGFIDRGGRGLGVVATDVDGDNLVDLFVANDGTANYLFRNRGGFRFEEVGEEAGIAGNAEGGYQAGMGVASGDLDGDGKPELVVTNFYGEATTLYRNLGRGLFSDRTAAVGLASASRHRLGFGAAFLDANNDGRLDLMTVNGHVNDNRPFYPYAMPAQLLLGDERGRLVDVTEKVGAPLDVPRVGRGLATGDIDNDGRVDALVLSQNEPLAYLRNATEGGHWVVFRLEGTTSNRDAVGATVTLTRGGRKQVQQRIGGGSYQSACDGRLHFGLGTATRVDEVEVRWPSGRVDRYAGAEADRGYLVREGEAVLKPLAGFRTP